jgi:hypothetical protein
MSDEQFAKSRLYYEGLLPGNIYRLRNHSFAKIVGASNNDEDARRVDRDQLIDVARKLVYEWDGFVHGKVDQSLLSALKSPDDALEVVCPDAVYIDPFPMMLSCNKCKVLDYQEQYLKNSDSIKRALKRVIKFDGRYVIPCRRSGCQGHMKQVPFVSIHRCGKMTPIDIPHASMRIKNLGYKDFGGSFLQSTFFDVDTGSHSNHSLQHLCKECKTDFPDATNLSKRGSPVGNREKFYPHNLQYLCLKETTGKMVSVASSFIGVPGDPLTAISADLAEAVASTLIGLTTPDQLAQHIESTIKGNGPDKSNLASIAKTLAEKRSAKEQLLPALSSMSESVRNSLLITIDTEIESLADQLKIASGRFSEVRHYLPDDDFLQFLVSHRRSMEAALLGYDFRKERETLVEMIAGLSDPIRRDKLLQDSIALKQLYGISEVSHFKEINVVMASLGYTRESPKPGLEDSDVPSTVLMGYEDTFVDRLRSKRLIYALPARTEALQIRLDPCRVLQWCVNNAGWENPGDDILNHEISARAHLFKYSPALSMDPAEVSAGTLNRPLRESAPFHLVHTISHCLLGTIKRHTGYDNKSVMEYLVPMDLSIIIYVTSVQNYTAGGLLTLFRHYLRQWFDDASNYAFNCIFDPICSDKGATCSGCVQIVLGCETFNHGLSRSYLHGGKLDEEQQIEFTHGFWQ